DRVLEAPGELGDDRVRQPLLRLAQAGVGARRVDGPSRRRLQAREGKVVGVAEPGAGERGAVPACRLRRTLDRRAAGVVEAEQPAHLVERLAGRVIDGLAEQPVGEVVAYLDQEGVPA